MPTTDAPPSTAGRSIEIANALLRVIGVTSETPLVWIDEDGATRLASLQFRPAIDTDHVAGVVNTLVRAHGVDSYVGREAQDVRAAALSPVGAWSPADGHELLNAVVHLAGRLAVAEASAAQLLALGEG